jgi:hypothetical protein
MGNCHTNSEKDLEPPSKSKYINTLPVIKEHKKYTHSSIKKCKKCTGIKFTQSTKFNNRK